jgi:Endoplasmic Reticulum Oxidoreductin 1 (ERO1)
MLCLLYIHSWGPNIQFFTSAVGAHPDRLTNLYFAYLFCLRALAKAAPLLQQYDYSTGNAAADNVTAALMQGLVKCEPSLILDANLLESGGISAAVNSNATAASAQCMRGFDEKGMFEVWHTEHIMLLLVSLTIVCMLASAIAFLQ